MRRLTPSIASLLASLVLVILAAACGAEGTTATCDNNVTADGVFPEENGCQQFAVCDKGSPEACCPETPGNPCDQVFCLFGYGVRTAETVQCFGGTPPTGDGDGGSGGDGGGGGGGGGGNGS